MTDKEVLSDLYEKEGRTHRRLMNLIACFPGPEVGRDEIDTLLDDLEDINKEIAIASDVMGEDQDILHVTQVNITEIQEAGANE